MTHIQSEFLIGDWEYIWLALWMYTCDIFSLREMYRESSFSSAIGRKKDVNINEIKWILDETLFSLTENDN